MTSGLPSCSAMLRSQAEALMCIGPSKCQALVRHGGSVSWDLPKITQGVAEQGPCQGLLTPEHIFFTSAASSSETYLQLHKYGLVTFKSVW